MARRAVVASQDACIEERREALYLVSLIASVDRNSTGKQDMTDALRQALLFCKGSEDPRILALTADLHFRGGDFNTAERYGFQAVSICQNLPGESIGSLLAGIKIGIHAGAHFQLARAQHHLGNFEEAMTGFEIVKRLIEEGNGLYLKPHGNGGMYLRLGLLKLSTEKLEDEQLAQECLEKVVKEDGRCKIAKRALGVLIGRHVLANLKRGSQFQKGEKYKRAVLLLSEGLMNTGEAIEDVPANLVYAGLMEESSPKLALQHYSMTVLKLKKKNEAVDPEIWNNMASLAARIGETDEANKFFSKIDPSYSKAFPTITYNRGRLAEISGELEKAEEIFSRFKADDLHYHSAITRLAVLAMNNDAKADQAERLLQEAMREPTAKNDAAAFLSKLYEMQKKYRQAQDLLEENRFESEYMGLAFASFMHRFIHNLDKDRKERFLSNHIGKPLITLLKNEKSNVLAANGVGVYFAELGMMKEASEAFLKARNAPFAVQTVNVNRAHTLVKIGHENISKSARETATGHPSEDVVSSSRALFEQASNLYKDAAAENSSSPERLVIYCELLLYNAWAEFEAKEFRNAADILGRVCALMPSSTVSWLNLGLALYESATKRAKTGKNLISELKLAKEEYEACRRALKKVLSRSCKGTDNVSRTRVNKKLVYDLYRYVHHQARKHEMSLANALNEAEDKNKLKRKRFRELERRAEKEEEEKAEARDEERMEEVRIRNEWKEIEKKRKRCNEEANVERYRE